MAREVGPDATSSSPKTLQRAQSTKASGASNSDLFAKGIVVEVLNDPEEFRNLLKADEENYVDRVKDIQVALSAPRGSLLYKAMDDQSSKELNIAYPFFSSHLMIPVHVGEQIWILETPDDYAYWLTRISANAQVEDVNYTHKDRELELPNEINDDAKSKADTQKGQKKNIIPRTNDGAGGDMGGAKNAPEGEDAKTLKESNKTSTHLEEPVPRFIPRVGDLALQGSNNTLISLGTDRGWAKNDDDFSVSNAFIEEPEQGRGSIDIVVGRGMSEEELKPTTEKTKGDDPKRTAARLAENDLGKNETDKACRLNEMEPNAAEGDPDFHLDSSRIYLSMKSPIDERLTLEEEIPMLREGTIEPMDAACIAMKSNEFRIISRFDGSVQIIKEKGDDNTPCSVVLLPDGTMHLSGEKIFIGKSSDDGGLDEGPGPGGSQPWIKYSMVEEYLTDIHKALDAFCGTMLSHTTPGYGAPSPQIISASAELRSKLKTAEQKIVKFQSERIYGE